MWDRRAGEFPQLARSAREAMGRWQNQDFFAGVRDKESLAKLPEAEREQWQRLWDGVAETLRRAGDKPPQPNEGDKKP
jgi:hypothetical protein